MTCFTKVCLYFAGKVCPDRVASVLGSEMPPSDEAAGLPPLYERDTYISKEKYFVYA